MMSIAYESTDRPTPEQLEATDNGAKAYQSAVITAASELYKGNRLLVFIVWLATRPYWRSVKKQESGKWSIKYSFPLV